jgi:hypothetical protein
MKKKQKPRVIAFKEITTTKLLVLFFSFMLLVLIGVELVLRLKTDVTIADLIKAWTGVTMADLGYYAGKTAVEHTNGYKYGNYGKTDCPETKGETYEEY